MKKRCIKRDFKGIHDRFSQDHDFRERMIENNRDEEVCRAWDVLAEQDRTYHMSEEEYFHYRQNWWISLEETNSFTPRSPYPSGSTNNGDWHRVLPPPCGNGKNPGGLPQNSKKVKKEEASKGL